MLVTDRHTPASRARPDPTRVSALAGPEAPGDLAVAVHDLRMRYGSREVLRGIDLTVARGEVFAFLGPNGAGKTTTVEILEGFRARSGGEVRVLGEDPRSAGPAWRDRVGVVLQSCVPEPDLTVQETVRLYAGFYARPRPVAEVLAMTGLSEHARVRNHRLSGGQQRRLDVALALVGDPDLLFLDEPTTGFDPAARRSAWEVLRGLRRLGTTIFLTTHYLEEAEALADRIAVIVDGRIVAEGTPLDLGGRDRLPTQITFRPAPPLEDGDLPCELVARGRVRAADGRVVIETTDSVRDLLALTTWAVAGARTLEGLEVRTPTLEDAYLALTNRGEDR